MRLLHNMMGIAALHALAGPLASAAALPSIVGADIFTAQGARSRRKARVSRDQTHRVRRPNRNHISRRVRRKHRRARAA